MTGVEGERACGQEGLCRGSDAVREFVDQPQGRKYPFGGLHAAGGEVSGGSMLTPCCSPAVIPAVQPDHRGGGHNAAAEGALHGGIAGAGAEGQPAPGLDPSPPGAGGLH